MEDHAMWRYLLNTDGQGASWRLAKLLAINSVVLKYRSHSIEYYYRSLREVRAGRGAEVGNQDFNPPTSSALTDQPHSKPSNPPLFSLRASTMCQWTRVTPSRWC
jgi:hypothetical protein